ncbi:uncharacterized protein LOC124124984 [Haliotis rufescens]|uniref:uncharacterized protein LOC124124984 n=1 Tax=Haliotis rufescens TaxID=6454 RepID=UPI00201ECD5B|nr:uncharacterized protein LOC124124984 [Haliotis rufescens]
MTSCVSCDCEARDDTSRSSTCAVCNRGHNLACTAEHLSKQLPDKWPGTTNGNILRPAKRNLLKGIQKQESHLAAIHVLSQYTGHLLQIYKKTQTEAAVLYTCTSNERIGATLTKVHDEDLNWPDNNATISLFPQRLHRQ